MALCIVLTLVCLASGARVREWQSLEDVGIEGEVDRTNHNATRAALERAALQSLVAEFDNIIGEFDKWQVPGVHPEAPGEEDELMGSALVEEGVEGPCEDLPWHMKWCTEACHMFMNIKMMEIRIRDMEANQIPAVRKKMDEESQRLEGIRKRKVAPYDCDNYECPIRDGQTVWSGCGTTQRFGTQTISAGVEVFEIQADCTKKCGQCTPKRMIPDLQVNRFKLAATDKYMTPNAGPGVKGGADTYEVLRTGGWGSQLGKTLLGACGTEGASEARCQWIFEPSLTREDHYYIKAVGTSSPSYYLSVKNGNAEGNKVALHGCWKDKDYSNCQWQLIEIDGSAGLFKLKVAEKELYLTAHGDGELAELYVSAPGNFQTPMQTWLIESFKLPDTLISDDDRCERASATNVFGCGDDVYQYFGTALQSCNTQGTTSSTMAWRPAARPTECSKQRADEQNAVEQTLRAFQKEGIEFKFKLQRMKRDVQAFQDRFNGDDCGKFMNFVEGIKGVIEKLKSLLCEIVQLAMSLYAWVLDKVLATAITMFTGIPVTAMQANPLCNAIINKAGPGNLTTIGLAVKGANAAVGQTLCKVGEKNGIGDRLKEVSKTNNDLRKMNFNTCDMADLTAQLIAFAINIACGKFVTAMLTLLMPMIMCNLPLRADGSMCQKTGCYW